MGQKVGKARLHSSATPFANLSRKAIQHTWQMFNDIADSFGIGKDELEEICSDLKDEINVSRLSMIEFTSSLFYTLDTDHNGLIDALEFIGMITCISGMRLHEILEFVLKSYDFDGTDHLSVDEIVLSLKSLASGLCKIELEKNPGEEAIEHLVTAMCSNLKLLNCQDASNFRVGAIVEYLVAHPDIKSWYSHFEIIEECGQCGGKELDELQKTFDLSDHELVKCFGEKATIDWNLVKMSYVCPRRTFEEEKKLSSFKVGDDTCNKDDVITTAPSWKSTVPLLVPLQYANTDIDKASPETSLEISWVYGYQGERSRNNVFYTSQGSIVYHVGRFAVIYNLIDHCQLIFTAHNNEISALAIHPSGRFVATAEFSSEPKLIIWNVATLEIVFVDGKSQQKCISSISFSTDGKLVITIGNDPNHTVVMYCWESNELLFTSFVSISKCLDCCFRKDGVVVVGGDTFLYFWYRTDEGYIRRQGIFSKHVPKQAITCVVPSVNVDSVISGTTRGHIFLWVDRNCVKYVNAHDGPINTMFSSDHGVLSGGDDCRIRIWSHKLDPGATFDLNFFGILPSIRSSSLSTDGTCIAFGTLGGNVFEISAIDGSDLRGGPIACSHYTGKLRNVSTHPSKHEFTSVGDDKLLRIWDMKSHTLLKIAAFDGEAKAVAYGPLGDIIAVGLGGEKTTNGKSGAFVVLNEDDLSIIHEARDSATPVTLVSFSPEGETLAIACDDGPVYLYAVQDEYELIGRCVRHARAVTQLDFSIDGEWIRTNSLEGDIGFFNADDASFQSNFASMRDVQWFTHTCIYSWHVQSAHRSPFCDDQLLALHTPSPTSKFLGCGTSTGYVRLHPFPCVASDSECQRYQAHCGGVSSVRFSFCGEFMISSGLLDRCIILWSVREQRSDLSLVEVQRSIDVAETDDYRSEAREGFDIIEDFMKMNSSAPSGAIYASQSLSYEQNLTAADSWVGQITPPSNPPIINHTIPEMSLKLMHVYGYRSQDVRNQVRYNSAGDIVFVSATFGVVMEKYSRAQNFYKVHTDAISAVTSTNDATLFATGQMGHHAMVAVWDPVQLVTLRILPDNQRYAVTALRFSNDNVLLAVASLDEDHTISVYNWKHTILISRTHGGSGRVFGLIFSEDNTSLLSCGVKFIKVWDVTTKYMTCVKPALGEAGVLQSFLCCDYFSGSPVVGSIDGNLFVLSSNGDSLSKNIKAHDGEICSLSTFRKKDIMQLFSGGKDGTIRIWNSTFDCLREISLENILSYRGAKIRSLHLSKDGNVLLIGTRGSEIVEVNITSGTLIDSRPLLQGHGHKELWGLATHPKKDEFVTTGDDGTLRVWDLKNFIMTKRINIDAASRAVAYSHDGTLLAVGFGSGVRLRTKSLSKDGAFIVLQSSDYKIVHEGKDSNESVRVIKFSNDGKLLAIGSDDSKIYLYNIRDKYTRRAIVSTHKAPIMCLDFTVDSKFLMTVDSTNRIYYFETATGMNVPSVAALRDEKWATWSSPVGYPVQGFWLHQPKGVYPSCIQRSWSGMMVACGNTNGRLYVSHSPCVDSVGFVDNNGHAGNVSRICWSAGDTYILTIGSNDHTIMQWKCVYDNARESGEEGGLSCEDSEIERMGGLRSEFQKVKHDDNDLSPHWLMNIAPPSDLKEDGVVLPNSNFELETIHGLRMSDCRQTLLYNEDGDILFGSSSCVVIYDRDKHCQRINDACRGPISCIDINCTGMVGSSGSCQKNPELMLWNARTGKRLGSHTGIHKNGITSVKFSTKSDLLITLGQDEMNSVVLLKSPSLLWHDSYILASCGVSLSKMFWVLFADGNEYPIVVGGNRCLFFLRSSGCSMERVRGVFGRRRKLQAMLCGVVSRKVSEGIGSNSVLTGTVTGHVYQWVGRTVQSVFSAHDAPINSITRCRDGFLTGAKDGLIKMWSHDMKLQFVYNVLTFTPAPYNASIYSLTTNKSQTKLLIGTRGGEAYEITLDTSSVSLLCEGHSVGQLHALGMNPTIDDELATGGDDGLLRIWSLSHSKCLRRSNIGSAIRSVAWNTSGSIIVVGIGGDQNNVAKDGTISVVDVMTLNVLFEDRKAKQWITDIKFTEKTFVVMSRDGCAYIHDSEKFNLIRKIDTPNKAYSGIFCGDISLDGNYIRFGCTNMELYFFKVGGELVTSPVMVRNVEWSTHTCVFNWMTKGCWKPLTEGVSVLSIDVCTSRNLIAVAFDNAEISLYAYPCQNFVTQNTTLKGISSVASRVLFSSTGSYLVALDRDYRAVLVYKC